MTVDQSLPFVIPFPELLAVPRADACHSALSGSLFPALIEAWAATNQVMPVEALALCEKAIQKGDTSVLALVVMSAVSSFQVVPV